MILRCCLSSILLLLLLHTTAVAQRDTIQGRRWTSFKPSLLVGSGFMPKSYAEPGIAFRKFYPNGYNSMSSTIYSSLEITGTMYYDRGFLLLAPKIGWQVSSSIYACAIEAKYMSDGKNKDFVLAPKIGLSLGGLVNLMYGYQVSFNKRPYPRIGAHQFGLSLVLNRAAFTSPARQQSGTSDAAK